MSTQKYPSAEFIVVDLALGSEEDVLTQFRRIRRLSAERKAILGSGDAFLDDEAETRKANPYWLPKPFTVASRSEAIRTATKPVAPALS